MMRSGFAWIFTATLCVVASAQHTPVNARPHINPVINTTSLAFSLSGKGSGQGLPGFIQAHLSSGTATVTNSTGGTTEIPVAVLMIVTPASGATCGDALVIYCSGLGAVNPAVPDGAAAPLSTLANTVNPVTVTIGGRPAQVLFAGLAPGFAGLYQVNAIVPQGVTADADVPVILTAAGFSSAPVTVAIE